MMTGPMLSDWSDCPNPITTGNCCVCDKVPQSTDSLVSCQLCPKFTHLRCLGLQENPIIGHLAWSCQQCGPIPKLSTILSSLSSMEAKLNSVLNIADKVDIIERKLNQNKVYPNPRIYSNVTKTGLNSAPSSSEPIETVFRGKLLRNNSVSSNSSKRHRSDSQDKPVKPKFITGSSTSDSLQGVSKPPPRRHVYVGRISKEFTDADVKSWCSANKAPILYIRKVSGDESIFNSFHCIFAGDLSEKIDSPAFWPENVIVKRFFLNEKAKVWLKSLKTTD